MPNHLAGETSPYLLQHADNPVNWYPWGAEAFAAAREQTTPSCSASATRPAIGAMSWPMNRLKNEATAGLMNRSFINIKVDREERPDVDSIYMSAVQALTNQGGWPMTVFLTPDGKPFYGGTYFPPQPALRHAQLPAAAGQHRRGLADRRDEIENSAAGIAEHLQPDHRRWAARRRPLILRLARSGAERHHPQIRRATKAASAARPNSRPP